jgi:hypothetical protein
MLDRRGGSFGRPVILRAAGNWRRILDPDASLGWARPAWALWPAPCTLGRALCAPDAPCLPLMESRMHRRLSPSGSSPIDRSESADWLSVPAPGAFRIGRKPLAFLAPRSRDPRRASRSQRRVHEPPAEAPSLGVDSDPRRRVIASPERAACPESVFRVTVFPSEKIPYPKDCHVALRAPRNEGPGGRGGAWNRSPRAESAFRGVHHRDGQSRSRAEGARMTDRFSNAAAP